jgi:periplasmic divalent cation tolerance protein
MSQSRDQLENLENYGVVLVTAASQSEAETIAELLITSKLAACVNLLPIRSIYSWKGELCRDEEWQLIIKTQLDQVASLEAKIREVHSYETPEVIAIPIVAGSREYLEWVKGEVAGR